MKKLTLWIMIFALTASAMGAAAGIVLSGSVKGDVKVAVSQPLKIETPTFSGIPNERSHFGGVSDTGTEFSAAVELYQGETVVINVPIVNNANVDHVVEIVMTPPQVTVPARANPSDYSINLDVKGNGVITDVVRVDTNTWKCTVASTSLGNSSIPFDGVKVTVALGRLLAPGYYSVSGQIQVVSY
jgi:hypothetical protein